MSPLEIKLELYKRRPDVNMAKIGRKLNVSQQAVQRVIERDTVSQRIMLAIAEAIERPPELVFPEHQFECQPN